MFKLSRVTLFIVALVAALGLLASVTPAFAAGINISPKSGNTATTFDVSGSGFNKNEQVSVWVGLSNGTNVTIGTKKANASGDFSISFTPDSSWKTGETILVARGQSSHAQVQLKFQLGKSGDTSSDTGTVTTTSTSNGTLVGVTSKYTLTYFGSGYTAGELVSTWFQYPSELGSSTSHPLANQTADGSGNVTFTFSVDKSYPFGGYEIAAQGYTSKHITYNTFSFFNSLSSQVSYSGDTGTITGGGWYGEYFNNMDLAGDPVLTRTDPEINFDWGTGSPGNNVNADNFSVRWTSDRNVTSAGNYTISATADDGIRVWVDGNLVIDNWYDQPATTHTASVYLAQGSHHFRVEYYEDTLYAEAIVSITQ